MTEIALPTYTAKDFTSDQEIRWCPGCGDYAVLKAVQKTMPDMGVRREDVVFVSGIGCAARFPYYMNTYGLHSIHGRAPAFATGIKIANPDLQVWLVSGDGDLLSIGGNHTMHTMRRNVDINILLLNNKIYGLTKGQYSPTSEQGKTTKSTPMGSLDYPVSPLSLAAGSGCTFFGRTLDIDMKMLDGMMHRAAEHSGTSFIEIYQDCNIFNHQAWFYASKKDGRKENTLELVHGEPMIFGTDRDKGLRMSGTCSIEVVELGGAYSESDLIVHDERNLGMAFQLAELSYPDFPEPMGIFYADPTRDRYEALVHNQMNDAIERHGKGCLESLLTSSDSWTVE